MRRHRKARISSCWRNGVQASWMAKPLEKGGVILGEATAGRGKAPSRVPSLGAAQDEFPGALAGYRLADVVLAG